MARDLSLKDKNAMVQALWTSVNEGGAALKDVPLAVKNVLVTGAWREREWNGRVIKHASFRSFIEAQPIEGCGWDVEKVGKLLTGDPNIETMYREAIGGGQGARHDLVKHGYNIPTLREGKGKKRPTRGTSRAHTLSRLKNDYPEKYEAVCRGEMSANKAAIEAGFRCAPKPFEQVKRLLPKLTAEERRQLKEML